MPYRLAIDLGTTFTAAATSDENGTSILALGNRALQIPSVLYLSESGEVFVGEAAERRGASDPSRLVREFKRRLGDDVPIMVAGAAHTAAQLTAHLLRWVVARANERLGEAPSDVVLAHPASWGPYKRKQLADAAAMAGVSSPSLCTEPEAAGARYAAQNRVSPGDKILVYDLGGGTFDVCVLEKTADGFAVLGTPDGVDRLGGVDFDDAVFTTVIESVLGDSQSLDLDDPEVMLQMARLRRDCVEAKEGLSSDVDTTLIANVGSRSTPVRLTRTEFQEMITPALELTVRAVRRALRSSGVEPSELKAIVLVGGSSRIPAVAELMQREFGAPIGVDIHPKHDIALGALLLGSTAPERLSPSLDSGLARSPEDAPAVTSPSAARRQSVSAAEGWLTTRHRRILLIASAAATLAGIAVGWGVVASNNQPDAVEPTPPASISDLTTPSSTTSPVDPNLPRSVPLAPTQLAIGMDIDKNADIYLADIDHARPGRRLTRGAIMDFAPLISPDRASIIYVQRFIDDEDRERRRLRVMAADGSGDRPLFARPPRQCDLIASRPAWSPVDQTLLAVPCWDTSGNKGLYLIRTSGDVVSSIDIGAPNGARWGVADPTFSSDGTQLAFWAGPEGYDGGALFVSSVLSGGPPRQLTSPEVPGGDSDPAWSPDGSTIAFRRNTPDGTRLGRANVYLTQSDGLHGPSPLVRAGADTMEPTWSPDGKSVAYLSREKTSTLPDQTIARVWVINTEGTGRRLLWTAGELGTQSGPSWTRR